MGISPLKFWVANEILTASDLNAEFSNTNSQLITAATQSEVDGGITTNKGLTPIHNRLTLTTEQASTSSTSRTFSSIPTGTRRITIHWIGVSTSGTSDLLVRLGDSGGIETSGYLGACTTIAGATPATANVTAGFGITNGHAAADILHGSTSLVLENASTYTWSSSSVVSLSNAATINIGSGSKSLSAELTSVALTTVGGTDTFDAGVVNITYER